MVNGVFIDISPSFKINSIIFLILGLSFENVKHTSPEETKWGEGQGKCKLKISAHWAFQRCITWGVLSKFRKVPPSSSKWGEGMEGIEHEIMTTELSNDTSQKKYW